MLSNTYRPFEKIETWYGVNAKDSNDNMLPGELHIDSINVYSDPQGGLGSRLGYSGITAGSIGTAIAWCGLTQFVKGSNSYTIGGASDRKIYKYESGAYSPLISGVNLSGVNDRISFCQLNNILVAVDGSSAYKWTGTGTAVTLGGTLITADWCLEWQNYVWLHSTASPRDLYYCTTPYDPESGYTSYLRFDRDPGDVTAASTHGDDMLVGKLRGLYRVQYTGSEPLFTSYRFGKVGPVSFECMKEVETGVVIFFGSDYTVYMVVGDEIVDIGQNIKPFIKQCQKARFQYAVAGVNRARHQYHLSLTYKSNSTTNDRILVCDYDRPYSDKWGKIQYPWFIFEYNDGANCFAEIESAGENLLYHGGYIGKVYEDDTGTNDDGSAFTNVARTKSFTEGVATLEKKYKKLFMDFENKGTHNLNVGVIVDDNADTQKVITQSMSGGSGEVSLWDVAYWDEGYWSGESNAEVGRDIDRVGKQIYFLFGTSGLDYDWQLNNYTYIAKPLRLGTVRTRE